MHTAHFTDAYLPVLDGVVRTVEAYQSRLPRELGPSTVVAPWQPGAVEDDRVVRYRSFPFRAPYRLGAPMLDRALQRRLKTLEVDLVHAHSPFGAGTLAREHASRTKKPLIFTLHSNYPEWVRHQYSRTPYASVLLNAFPSSRKQPWPGVGSLVSATPQGSAYAERIIKRELWRFGQQSDCVLVATERLRREFASFSDEGAAPRVEVLRLGIDFPTRSDGTSIRELYSLPGDVPVFLTVGQLTFEKELPFLLTAMSEVRARRQKFRLILVGDGPYRAQFEADARKLGIGDWCIFAGTISDKKRLAAHYEQADLFLFPSLYETQGLVAMEAASFGVPTVAQREAPGISEVFTHEVSAFFSERSPRGYAALVLALCTDPTRANQVGNAARARVVRIEQHTQQLARIYEDVSRKHQSHACECRG